MFNAVPNGTNVTMIHVMLTRPTLLSRQEPLGNMKAAKKNAARRQPKANCDACAKIPAMQIMLTMLFCLKSTIQQMILPCTNGVLAKLMSNKQLMMSLLPEIHPLIIELQEQSHVTILAALLLEPMKTIVPTLIVKIQTSTCHGISTTRGNLLPISEAHDINFSCSVSELQKSSKQCVCVPDDQSSSVKCIDDTTGKEYSEGQESMHKSWSVAALENFEI